MKRRRCGLHIQHDPHEWSLAAEYPSFGRRLKGVQKGVVLASSYWCPGTVKCES